MNFPDNLKYTKDHEWIKVEGNQAIVGITAFAAGAAIIEMIKIAPTISNAITTVKATKVIRI